MSQTVTLQEIENSKIYVSPKSDSVRFKHPIDYIRPMLDTLESAGAVFKFEAQIDSINKEKSIIIEDVEQEGQENVSYSRLIVKARLPVAFNLNLDFPTDFDELSHEIGLVYGLDTAMPEIRAYSGKRVSVCINQAIFGADNIISLNLLKSNTNVIYDSISKYADKASESLIQYREIAERLYDEKLSGQKLLAKIGRIHWEAKIEKRLGINFANEAMTLVQNNKTRYALDENNSTNSWTLYNACTEALKKSSILDEASKVILLDKIFKSDN